MNKLSLLLALAPIALLATSPVSSAQQSSGPTSRPGAALSRTRGAITGLQRIQTPADDLLIEQRSTSSTQLGLLFVDDVWEHTHTDDSYVAFQLDTAVVTDHGRSENHTFHEAYAFPPVTPGLTTPVAGNTSNAYHAMQLHSSGLDQGYVEVYAEPTGDVAGTWAVSASEVTIEGSFDVIVNPALNPQNVPGTQLQVESRFRLHFGGAPHGALVDGALFRKEIGDSYVEAVYSKAGDVWIITGQLSNCGCGPTMINELHPGQDLGFFATAVQVVSVGEVLTASELTDFAVILEANDGFGPDLAGMQFTSLNSGYGGLFLR